MVLVDSSLLLHPVVWPVAGTAADLALSFGVRLSRYPPEAQQLVLFDRYYEDEPTANDHERIRLAGAGSKDFHLTPNTPIPYREAILKMSKNKSLLASIRCEYPLQNNVQLVNKLDCLVTHEEADITLCSYMPQLAVQKRLGSFVTTLTCSSVSSNGHGGRLPRRTSRWRSGTAPTVLDIQLAAVTVLDFPVRSATTARGRCGLLSLHTEEDQLHWRIQWWGGGCGVATPP